MSGGRRSLGGGQLHLGVHVCFLTGMFVQDVENGRGLKLSAAGPKLRSSPFARSSGAPVRLGCKPPEPYRRPDSQVTTGDQGNRSFCYFLSFGGQSASKASMGTMRSLPKQRVLSDAPEEKALTRLVSLNMRDSIDLFGSYAKVSFDTARGSSWHRSFPILAQPNFTVSSDTQQAVANWMAKSRMNEPSG